MLIEIYAVTETLRFYMSLVRDSILSAEHLWRNPSHVCLSLTKFFDV